MAGEKKIQAVFGIYPTMARVEYGRGCSLAGGASGLGYSQFVFRRIQAQRLCHEKGTKAPGREAHDG